MLQKQKEKTSKRGQKKCDRNEEEKTRQQLKERNRNPVL
jgi:hypothetical protein